MSYTRWRTLDLVQVTCTISFLNIKQTDKQTDIKKTFMVHFSQNLIGNALILLCRYRNKLSAHIEEKRSYRNYFYAPRLLFFHLSGGAREINTKFKKMKVHFLRSTNKIKPTQ